MPDFAAEFAARDPIASADHLFDEKVVKPSRKGDVELCFDFGGQVCGYFEFSIQAEEGVIVDLNAIEFIREDGVLQHVHKWNRNGLRYVTKKGVNRFTSLKRRSGRYLFVTLRNQKTPVEIKSLRIIESTALVEAVGSFECSDPMLNRVWKMSERTLQLCMEDTFTDCPLYEQTLWTQRSALCFYRLRKFRCFRPQSGTRRTVARTVPDCWLPGPVFMGLHPAGMELFVGNACLGALFLQRRPPTAQKAVACRSAEHRGCPGHAQRRRSLQWNLLEPD